MGNAIKKIDYNQIDVKTVPTNEFVYAINYCIKNYIGDPSKICDYFDEINNRLDIPNRICIETETGSIIMNSLDKIVVFNKLDIEDKLCILEQLFDKNYIDPNLKFYIPDGGCHLQTLIVFIFDRFNFDLRSYDYIIKLFELFIKKGADINYITSQEMGPGYSKDDVPFCTLLDHVIESKINGKITRTDFLCKYLRSKGAKTFKEMAADIGIDTDLRGWFHEYINKC